MYVASFQMTGRKGRVVRQPDGSVRYESRAEQGHTIDQINLKEKDRFMNGDKVRHLGSPLENVFCKSFPKYHKETFTFLISSVSCHHIRSGQFGHLASGRQKSKESASEGSHDPGAALERRQGHPAVW